MHKEKNDSNKNNILQKNEDNIDNYLLQNEYILDNNINSCNDYFDKEEENQKYKQMLLEKKNLNINKNDDKTHNHEISSAKNTSDNQLINEKVLNILNKSKIGMILKM